jgi:hypothetical protein
VIEEYYRFMANNEAAAAELKRLRHELMEIEGNFGPRLLLQHRDSANDCFADAVRPEEMRRSGAGGLLTANFKRAQEAARVIEEYAKIIDGAEASERAKKLRFSLYRMEQRFNGG